MITSECAVQVLEYIRQCCQVPQVPSDGYLEALMSELPEFDDESLKLAARNIIRNECLYGYYPAISVWLKYSPKHRAEIEQARKDKSGFIACVERAAALGQEHWSFTPEEYKDLKKEILAKYGHRAQRTLAQFGMLDRVVERLNNLRNNSYERNKLLNEIENVFEETTEDVRLGLIEKEPQKLLGN